MPMQFNYHDSDDEFMKFVMLAIATSVNNGTLDEFNELSDLTDKFTNVQLGITINDRVVPAEAFVNTVKRFIEHRAQELVKETLEEKMYPFDKLYEQLQEIERATRRQMVQTMLDADISVQDVESED